MVLKKKPVLIKTKAEQTYNLASFFAFAMQSAPKVHSFKIEKINI